MAKKLGKQLAELLKINWEGGEEEDFVLRGFPPLVALISILCPKCHNFLPREGKQMAAGEDKATRKTQSGK